MGTRRVLEGWQPSAIAAALGRVHLVVIVNINHVEQPAAALQLLQRDSGAALLDGRLEDGSEDGLPRRRAEARECRVAGRLVLGEDAQPVADADAAVVCLRGYSLVLSGTQW